MTAEQLNQVYDWIEEADEAELSFLATLILMIKERKF